MRNGATAVICWPLTAEACVRSQVSPCEICGEQGGTGKGFPHLLGVSLLVTCHQCSILFFLILAWEGQVDEAWECSNRARWFDVQQGKDIL